MFKYGIYTAEVKYFLNKFDEVFSHICINYFKNKILIIGLFTYDFDNSSPYPQAAHQSNSSNKRAFFAVLLCE